MVERRRRGAALEDALLDAAWAELVEHGYAGLTMESVAKRAGTSRPVLARRWETRSDLAIAAIRNYNKNNPIEAPDLHGVRDELIVLLQRFSDRGARIMTTVLLNMSEYFIETGFSIADIRERIIGDSKLKDVLERGVARGELDRRKLTARISTLPVDLVRHEVIMTRRPVSMETIEEILDTIFLPLAATSSPR
jgi:AcrR family transcriptional regulator